MATRKRQSIGSPRRTTPEAAGSMSGYVVLEDGTTRAWEPGAFDRFTRAAPGAMDDPWSGKPVQAPAPRPKPRKDPAPASAPAPRASEPSYESRVRRFSPPPRAVYPPVGPLQFESPLPAADASPFPRLPAMPRAAGSQPVPVPPPPPPPMPFLPELGGVGTVPPRVAPLPSKRDPDEDWKVRDKLASDPMRFPGLRVDFEAPRHVPVFDDRGQMHPLWRTYLEGDDWQRQERSPRVPAPLQWTHPGPGIDPFGLPTPPTPASFPRIGEPLPAFDPWGPMPTWAEGNPIPVRFANFPPPPPPPPPPRIPAPLQPVPHAGVTFDPFGPPRPPVPTRFPRIGEPLPLFDPYTR